MTTPGAALLAEAAETIQQREGAHGDKGQTFRVIAAMWSAYLAGRHAGPLDAVDVAQMMVLLKVARARCGDRTHADHYVDQAGYVACTADLLKPAGGQPRMLHDQFRIGDRVRLAAGTGFGGESEFWHGKIVSEIAPGVYRVKVALWWRWRYGGPTMRTASADDLASA